MRHQLLDSFGIQLRNSSLFGVVIGEDSSYLAVVLAAEGK
jgi:hypothetical protein